MDSKYSLKLGDIVAVNFNNAQITLCYEAELISYPCTTGGSWIFKDLHTGFLHYVSEGCTVSKRLSSEHRKGGEV